jgi:hypothetical protein
MERVKLYPSPEGGMPSKAGVGFLPGLSWSGFRCWPGEDEGRLHDDALRENFIERVFVMHRWNNMTAGRVTVADFQAFHAAHKRS